MATATKRVLLRLVFEQDQGRGLSSGRGELGSGFSGVDAKRENSDVTVTSIEDRRKVCMCRKLTPGVQVMGFVLWED